MGKIHIVVTSKLYMPLLILLVCCAVILFIVLPDKGVASKSSPSLIPAGNVASNSPKGTTVPMGAATTENLAAAFVFSQVTVFPNSDLIYVLRADARSNEADLIDSSGRWIASADYRPPDFSGDHSAKLYPACRAQLCGYIDNDGKWAIEPKFVRAMPFAAGVAAVYTDNKTKQYIDAKGNSVEQPNRPGLKSPLIVDSDWMIDRDSATWYTRDDQGAWKETRYDFENVMPFNKELVIARKSGQMMLVDRFGKTISTKSYEFIGEAKDDKAIAAQQGKWGVINLKGDWLIAPTYDAIAINPDGTFQATRDGHLIFMSAKGKAMQADSAHHAIAKPVEGLTAACQDVRCGFIDDEGKWVIKPEFDYVFSFSDGVARVIKNGLLGYIDHEGRWLTPEPPADVAAPWYWRPDALEGSQIYGESAVFGQLNRDGEFSSAVVFKEMGNFSEGLTPAISIGGKWGYIDDGQKWVIPPIFREAKPFSEGLALVKGGPWISGGISYIDVSGKVKLVAPTSFENAGSFNGGHAELLDYSGKISFIDKNGHVTPKPIDDVNEPAAANGPELSPLSINGGKWGYANAEDHFVIEPQFDEARSFVGDFAAVKTGGKWGFIGRDGKFIVEALYDEVGKFSEERVRVKKEGMWCYLDREGHIVGSHSFVMADDFQNGRAKAALSLGEARQRISGNNSIDGIANKNIPMLIEGSDMKNGIATVRLAGWQSNSSSRRYQYHWYALINRRGELVIPALRPKAPAAK